MSQKVRIALTLDLDNPVHKKAYALLSKLNRAHSEFIAYITSNFIVRNYCGNVSKISKSDAKILAICAKCCCNDGVYDFTADPKILGQLIMLLNQHAIISGSDVDTVIRKALANITLFSDSAEEKLFDSSPDVLSTSAPAGHNESQPSVQEQCEVHDSDPVQYDRNIDFSSSINSSDSSNMDNETSDEEDLDADDMPIEINEAALQAFNSML